MSAPLPGASRLVTIGVDGRDEQTVLENQDGMQAPNWSPDGRWLVYNAGGALFRVAADGRAPRLIETPGVADISNDHLIAPDGATILFSARPDIYAVPFAGGPPRRITNSAATPNRLVYWLHGITSDGKTLVHCGQVGATKTLWTLPTDGGPDLPLTAGAGEDDGPEFSSDGRFVFFNSNRGGSHQIWRIPAAGGTATQLTHDGYVNWFPHPSPDGRWIVFLSYPPGTKGHPGDRPVIIRRMRPDGSEVVELRRLFGGQGTINSPSWSPDARRFAFVEYGS